MAKDLGEDLAKFPVTHWSEVHRAGRPDRESGMRALDELLTRYRPALKAHLVLVRKVAPEKAEDILHDFLSRKVLNGSLVTRADPQKGKFRTILLTALDNYFRDTVRKEHAHKRRPDGGFVEMEDLEGTQAAAVGASQGIEVDAEWARQVIAEALRRTEDECRSSGQPEFWELLNCRLVAPIMDGAKAMSYKQLVAKFGFRSPTQASNALVTAKRRFVRALRSVVKEYADSDAEVEAEIKELQAILKQITA